MPKKVGVAASGNSSSRLVANTNYAEGEQSETGFGMYADAPLSPVDPLYADLPGATNDAAAASAPIADVDVVPHDEYMDVHAEDEDGTYFDVRADPDYTALDANSPRRNSKGASVYDVFQRRAAPATMMTNFDLDEVVKGDDDRTKRERFLKRVILGLSLLCLVLLAGLVAVAALGGASGAASGPGTGGSTGGSTQTTPEPPTCPAAPGGALCVNGTCGPTGCLCDPGFYGPLCENMCLQGCGARAGRGLCTAAGTCICLASYTGDACDRTTALALLRLRGDVYGLDQAALIANLSSLLLADLPADAQNRINLTLPVISADPQGGVRVQLSIVVPVGLQAAGHPAANSNGTVRAETVFAYLDTLALQRAAGLVASKIVAVQVGSAQAPWREVQAPCPNDCSGRGECQRDLSCKCDEGFSGDDCGVAPVFLKCLNDCNNNGLCLAGSCICDSGWSGLDCNVLRRACPGNCGNDPLRGSCNVTTGVCLCTDSYGGSDCGERLCIGGCGDNGVCNNGVCVCDPGFTGVQCEREVCLQGCGVGGDCIGGQCICRKTWNGPQCDIQGCRRDCSGRGTCMRDGDGDGIHDGDSAAAPWACSCEAGYRGDACQSLVELQCSDGFDNDDDDATDCDDVDCCSQAVCASDPSCMATPTLMEIVPPEELEPPKDENGRSYWQSVAFLVNGTNPSQVNASLAAFDVERVCVVHGMVMDRQEIPLLGVVVSIVGQPELGATLTRSDGTFDLLANGGGNVNLLFRRRNYIDAQRTPYLTPHMRNDLPPVAMLPVSKVKTVVQLGGASGDPDVIQIASGEESQDAAGNRTARMMFQGNNAATIVHEDGTTETVEAPVVRITEYTVGDTGPAAMPSELPNLSGYTYAVEVSLDQATTSGDTDVVFDEGVPFYVENNLGFPVGSAVPVGAFSRSAGNWRPEANGRVIRIVDIVLVDGIPTAVLEMRANLSYLDPPVEDCNIDFTLDDGTGPSEPALADRDENGMELISNAELEARYKVTLKEKQHLAQIYAVGDELWRVLMPHATPWDCNWPYGPPPDGCSPRSCDDDDLDDPSDNDDDDDDSCDKKGSIIKPQSQTLGENLGLVGTPFELVYLSNRVAGYHITIEVPVTTLNPPASLATAEVRMEIAGRTFTRKFNNIQPNLVARFTWDRTDFLGRLVMQDTDYVAYITYNFPLTYYPSRDDFSRAFGRVSSTTSFVRPVNSPPNPDGSDSRLIGLTDTQRGTISGRRDVRLLRLGGWSLDRHHFYDARTATLHLGTGDRFRFEDTRGQGRTMVGGRTRRAQSCTTCGSTESRLFRPMAVATHSDGSVFTGDDNVIYRTSKNGTTDVAYVFTTPVTTIYYMAVHPTWGDLLISRPDEFRLYRLTDAGQLVVVAGTGTPCQEQTFGDAQPCGDGGLAVDAPLILPRGIAVLKDGDIYLADGPLIRHITPDERIGTYAGSLRPSSCLRPVFVDDTPVSQAVLQAPTYLAAHPVTGALYFIDAGAAMIFRIDERGRVLPVAGYSPLTALAAQDTDDSKIGVSSVAALRVRLRNPMGLAVDQTSAVYFAETLGNINRLRKVDSGGQLYTVAGRATTGSCSSNAPCGDFAKTRNADELTFRMPTAIALQPSHVIVAAQQDFAIVSIGKHSILESDDYFVIPEPGTPYLHVFNRTGRHEETRDAETRRTLLKFVYDDRDNLLSEIRDSENNKFTLKRDAVTRQIESVTGLYGLRTDLTVNGDGDLIAAANSYGEYMEMRYSRDGQGRSTGLLVGLTDVLGREHHYEYDIEGRLIVDRGPLGEVTRLARLPPSEGLGEGVLVTEPEQLRTSIRTVPLADARGTLTTVVGPTGGVTKTESYADGSWKSSYEDGSTVEITLGPHPVWKSQMPLPVRQRSTYPDGTSVTVDTTYSAVLEDELRPLSLKQMTKAVRISNRLIYETTRNLDARTVTVNARGRTQLIAHLDTAGRVVRRELPGYGLLPVEYTYTDMGDLLEERMGAMWMRQDFDAQGRVVKWETSGNESMSYGYTGASHQVQTLIYPSDRRVRFSYDALGRMKELVMPSGARVGMAYHDYPEDEGAKFLLPGNRNMTRTFRLDGQPVRTTYPSGGTLLSSYDKAGRLVRQVASDGQFVATTYVGRTELPETAVRGGPGHPDVTLTLKYNGPFVVGASVRTPDGVVAETTYSLDSQTRVSSYSVTLGGSTIQSESISRDSAGELTWIGSYRMILRSDLGQQSMRKSDGFGVLMEFDTLGRLSNRALFRASNAVPVFTESPRYETAGNVIIGTQQVLVGQTRIVNYKFDVDGQLREVWENDELTETYAYDVNGNRQSWSIDGVSHSAEYRNDDAVTAMDGLPYTVNADGTLVSRLGASYAYTLSGHLQYVTLPTGGTIRYLYDGLGRRVQRINEQGQVTRYVYGDLSQPQRLSAIRGPDNVVWVFRYDTMGRVLGMQRVNTGIEYLVVTDHVGSPIAVFAPDSQVPLLRRTYDAFGNIKTETGSFVMPLGFAGGLMDPATGLVNFLFRDYDPLLGRFTSRDPSLLSAGSTNMFMYTFNDPINLRDPLGLICISASVFAIFGGGIELCASWDGVSACIEGGVGAGGGVGIDIFGQPKKGGSVEVGAQGSVKAGAGIGEVGIGGNVGVDLSPDSWRGSEKCDSRFSAGIAASGAVMGTEIAKVGANTRDGYQASLGPQGMGKESYLNKKFKNSKNSGTKDFGQKNTKGGKVGIKAEATATVKGCIGSGKR